MELNDKAMKMFQNSNNDSVLFFLDKAIEIDSSWYLPHQNKIVYYLKQNNIDNALMESELVIEKEPMFAEGWTMAGMLHEATGDSKKAFSYYQKSIEIFDNYIQDPEKSEQLAVNRVNRAFSLLLLEKKEEAMNEMIKAKIDFPNEPLFGNMDSLFKITKKDILNQILLKN